MDKRGAGQQFTLSPLKGRESDPDRPGFVTLLLAGALPSNLKAES